LGSDLDVTYSSFYTNVAGTMGGAISCYNDNVSIIHSTLSDNEARTYGGGLYSTCDVNLFNTTIHANRAITGGGGLFIEGGAFAAVNYVTIAGNSAPFGAGVYNDDVGGSTLQLQATLVADNDDTNCDGVITSNGYNMSDDNTCPDFVQPGDQRNVPLPLGPLRANGGPTLTLMLAPLNNAAVNAIPAAACGAAVDQRNVVRPQQGACDVGAVEMLNLLYMPKLIHEQIALK
jgi:hypothetical protein